LAIRVAAHFAIRFKMTSLLGNFFVRGGIVQGSDLRPPLGVEIRVRSKDILAVCAK